MEKTDKKTLGKIGENTARELLEESGYMILETNYRTKGGEIDIICQKDKKLIFVEVKTRRNLEYGMPREAVDKRKIIHMKKAAAEYLLYCNEMPDIEFMVIEVYLNVIENYI